MRSLRSGVVALLLLTGCGGGSDTERAAGGTRIVVASPVTDAPGSSQVAALLAEVYGQALRRAGVEVEVSPAADRDALVGGLRAGRIDLIVDAGGPLRARLDVRLQDQAAGVDGGVTYGRPAGGSTGAALVVTKALANRVGLTQVSDLRKLGSARLFVTGRCSADPSCATAVTGRLGVSQQAVPDEAAVKAALEAGGEAVGIVTGSDPQLAASGPFVVLGDDEGVLPPGGVLPAVRSAKAAPALVALLDRVSAALDAGALLRLTAAVVDRAEDPRTVAAGFLRDEAR